jgi:transcriptional regulator with XRE-family HTH domain
VFVPALLRRYRTQQALSQEELAEKAGLVRSTVLKLESGRAKPRPSTIRKLAKALGVKPADLMAADTL